MIHDHNFYLQKPKRVYKSNAIIFPILKDYSSWHEDSRITYQKFFKNGLRRGYNHMLPISKYMSYKVKKIFIEIDSYDELNEWIYGCTANVINASNVSW